MKNSLYKRLRIPLVLVACYGTLLADSTPAPEPKTQPSFDEIAYDWSRTFAKVLHTTHEKHYRPENIEQCMIKAIDSFLSNLDPHSNFFDPKTYKAILESTSGEFFGVGIILDNTRQPKDKFLLIVDTVPGGPADSAGLKALDKIIEIDGAPLEGMSTDEATIKLRGERNTVVHLKVLRDGQPDLLPFEVTRDVIKEQSSACFYLPEQNVYYVSLTTFSESAIKQIATLLEKAKKKRYKALVLDLRNNTGGLLNVGIDIAGLFLKKGSTVVVTKNKDNVVTDVYTTRQDPIADTQVPIFILVNNYTASAAEILAGSLKEHSEQLAQQAGSKGQRNLMVFIVGSRSFGKGSVQEVIPITNNCAVKITTSLYYLPNDVSIQGSGIIPDFVIEKEFPPTEQIAWFTKYYGREKTLANTIKPVGAKDTDTDKQKESENNKNVQKKEKEKTWADRAKEMLNRDNQFRGTLTLINLLHNAQTACPQEVNTRPKAVAYLSNLYVANKELSFEEVT